MKKRSTIVLLLIVAVFMLGVTGCKKNSKDTDVKNPVEDQTVVEVPNDTEDPVEPDNTEEPVKPDDTEEPVEPDDTEEPVVEMVDWETWATQADNNEVCIVVWNETTGTQKILKPVTDDNITSYTVEEGDRFAVPRRNNVDYVDIGYEKRLYWESENQGYMEIQIPIGQIKEVDIVCNDKDWALSFLFNY